MGAIMYRVINDRTGLCFRCTANEARFWQQGTLAKYYTVLREIIEDVMFYGPLALEEIE